LFFHVRPVALDLFQTKLMNVKALEPLWTYRGW
jgi:hypothetical protein